MSLEFKRKIRDLERSWATYLELVSSSGVVLDELKVLIRGFHI